MKDIVIYDACIFIDVIDMEILEALSKADYVIHTTSLVKGEIVRPEQRAAIERWLDISIYKYDKIEQYQDLFDFKESVQPRKNLSDPDFSILKLAIDKSAPLYTTDGKLREVAKIHGVQVHGSLGLVVELNRDKYLTKSEAQEAIAKLVKSNTRLSKTFIADALKALV